MRVLEPPDGTFAPAAGQQSLEPTPLLDAPGAFEPSSFDPASPLDSATPAAQDGPVGPVDGVVGGGDPTVDLRECTNEDCATREPDGPSA